MANLQNPKKIAEYLQEAGYKVSPSTVYKHREEGRIPMQKNGSFRIEDVDRYAAMHLRRLDGNKPSEDLDKLQRDKLEAETAKARAQAEHWEMKTRIERGQFIDKELFDGELAARAAIFKNDLETFFRAQAPQIISLVGGDGNKAPDLIDLCLERLEVCLGRYAQKKTWRVPKGGQLGDAG